MIWVLDLEDELDRSLGICPSRFIVACVDRSSEEMVLDGKRGLRNIIMSKGKGSAPKDASESQPSLLPPSLSVNPFVPANLNKKRKEKEVAEEGELVPPKEKVPPK